MCPLDIGMAYAESLQACLGVNTATENRASTLYHRASRQALPAQIELTPCFLYSISRQSRAAAAKPNNENQAPEKKAQALRF